jgi:hypothetical protein
MLVCYIASHIHVPSSHNQLKVYKSRKRISILCTSGNENDRQLATFQNQICVLDAAVGKENSGYKRKELEWCLLQITKIYTSLLLFCMGAKLGLSHEWNNTGSEQSSEENTGKE